MAMSQIHSVGVESQLPGELEHMLLEALQPVAQPNNLSQYLAVRQGLVRGLLTGATAPDAIPPCVLLSNVVEALIREPGDSVDPNSPEFTLAALAGICYGRSLTDDARRELPTTLMQDGYYNPNGEKE
jgi:hypothetical protein